MKKLSALFLSLILTLLVFTQVGLVAAQVVPLTSPITSPISSFSIKGQVTLKDLSPFISAINRIVPAADILIMVTNFFNPTQSYSATTDGSGNYGVNVPPGLYVVKVATQSGAFFVPPLKVVNIHNSSTTVQANFQGLLLPH